MADITRPPKKPIRQTIKPITAAWPWENGVIGAINAAMAVADKIPPTVPEMVLDGESEGMIFAPPISLPQTYCNTSDTCTTPIRKISNRILLPLSKPSKSRNISAGTWDRQKMQIIAIHCVLAARSKKCAVWPLRLAIIGSIKKP